MIYYISDLHLGDERVFKKCNRPFSSLVEMEKCIISRWNNKVHNNDTVYILGDIADEKYNNAIEVIKQLNGIKHLIIGNHDIVILDLYQKSNLFESIEFMKLINDNNRNVCLCHYPVMDWMEFSRGGYHIYGHIHNKSAIHNPAYEQIYIYYSDKLAYNSGADVTNFTPLSLDELIELKSNT